MKLIKEFNEKLICESVVSENNGKKDYFIEGVFLGDIKNRNGRVYPKLVTPEGSETLHEGVRE